MCGGVREFESMHAGPAAQMVSLLHDEIRAQYESAEDVHDIHEDHEYSASVVQSYVVSMMKLATRDIKARHEVGAVEAAPAGLAIVAAMGVESVPATMPARGPITKLHISTNHEEKKSARGNIKPAGRQYAAGRPGYKSSNAVPMSSSSSCGRIKREEERPRRSSIFSCSAISPPKDSYVVPDHTSCRASADFMGTCFLCQRPLGSGIDIYIYRGDRAFCSNECRYQHIVEDELSEPQNLPTACDSPAHCKKNRRVAASPAAAASPGIIRVLG